MRFAILLTAVFSLLVQTAWGADGNSPYLPSPDIGTFSKRIDANRAAALESGKLQLVVLGANWCHDSEDFAKKLDNPELSEVIDENYVLALEDVAFFELLDQQLSLLGIPVLYGTPTAVIIDPATGEVLNRHSLDTWRSSEMRPLMEATDYFSAAPMATPDQRDGYANNPVMNSIDAFEITQGQRITRAFQALGPIMAAMGKKTPTEAFLARWDDLGRLRGPLPDDLRQLRNEANRQITAGADSIDLTFPSYPPLMNESGDSR